MQTEKVIKRDNKYVLHTYARSRVVLAEGHGMTAADPEGKRYLDFTSGIGVNSLGYCHPAWVQAVCDQAATLPPAAGWLKSYAAAPAWMPFSLATPVPRPTRAPSRPPANILLILMVLPATRSSRW